MTNASTPRSRVALGLALVLGALVLLGLPDGPPASAGAQPLGARLTTSLTEVEGARAVGVRLHAREEMRIRLRAAVRSGAYRWRGRPRLLRLEQGARGSVDLRIPPAAITSLAEPGAVLRVVVRYRGGARRGRLVLRRVRPGDGAAGRQCPAFDSGRVAGSVDFGAAVELSGLAASRRNPGVLWTHNDSGDTERVFAIDETAHLIGTHVISAGLGQDWEDIAVGPGPEPATTYVYVGSIGGNSGRHDLHVYRAPEPLVVPLEDPYTVPLASTVKLLMQYPGGESYDAEALLADLNGDLYVVTKAIGGVARVFRYPLAAQEAPGTNYVMEPVASVTLPEPVTAGDISASGSEIVLKGYLGSYLWTRDGGSSVAQALAGAPCAIPHGYGEAFAFSASAGSYYTITEGSSVPLYRFDRLPG